MSGDVELDDDGELRGAITVALDGQPGGQRMLARAASENKNSH